MNDNPDSLVKMISSLMVKSNSSANIWRAAAVQQIAGFDDPELLREALTLDKPLFDYYRHHQADPRLNLGGAVPYAANDIYRFAADLVKMDGEQRRAVLLSLAEMLRAEDELIAEDQPDEGYGDGHCM